MRSIAAISKMAWSLVKFDCPRNLFIRLEKYCEVQEFSFSQLFISIINMILSGDIIIEQNNKCKEYEPHLFLKAVDDANSFDAIRLKITNPEGELLNTTPLNNKDL